MMSAPSLSDLAKTITESAGIIDGFLASSRLPSLSQSPGTSKCFPDQADAKVQHARFAAMDASKMMFELLWSAEERILDNATSV